MYVCTLPTGSASQDRRKLATDCIDTTIAKLSQSPVAAVFTSYHCTHIIVRRSTPFCGAAAAVIITNKLRVRPIEWLIFTNFRVYAQQNVGTSKQRLT